MRRLCVLLHGYPNNSLIWKDQIPFFREHFEILNLSLPGSETGVVKQEELKLDRLTKDLAGKILEKGCEEIILMGHDIGAFVLPEVAAHLGDKVRAMVLLGGMDFRLFSKRLRTSDQKFRSWYVLFFQAPVIPKLLVQKFRNLLSQKLYRSLPELKDEAPHGFTPIGIYRELPNGIRLAEKNTLTPKLPVLMLFGKDDPYIGAPSQEEVNEFYERAQVKVLPGGHWFLRENPDLVNAEIKKFLL